MQLFQILFGAGFVVFAAGVVAQFLAWPRLQALKARGLIRGPIPDFQEASYRPLTFVRLIWGTPIPADRKRLRRLLSVCRMAPLAALALFFAGAVAAGYADTAPARRDPPPRPRLSFLHGRPTDDQRRRRSRSCSAS